MRPQAYAARYLAEKVVEEVVAMAHHARGKLGYHLKKAHQKGAGHSGRWRCLPQFGVAICHPTMSTRVLPSRMLMVM